MAYLRLSGTVISAKKKLVTRTRDQQTFEIPEISVAVSDWINETASVSDDLFANIKPGDYVDFAVEVTNGGNYGPRVRVVGTFVENRPKVASSTGTYVPSVKSA